MCSCPACHSTNILLLCPVSLLLHRTNSDSALHTSAMNPNPQDPFGMNQQMGRGPPLRNGESTHRHTRNHAVQCGTCSDENKPYLSQTGRFSTGARSLPSLPSSLIVWLIHTHTHARAAPLQHTVVCGVCVLLCKSLINREHSPSLRLRLCKHKMDAQEMPVRGWCWALFLTKGMSV